MQGRRQGESRERARERSPFARAVTAVVDALTRADGGAALPEERLHPELVRLALREVIALELEADGGKDLGLDEAMRRAGLETLLVTGGGGGGGDSSTCVPEVRRWLGAGPRTLGDVYQELLTVTVRRRGVDSLCIGPERVWVSAGEVLASPARVRAKWLQRQAGLPKSAVSRLTAPLGACATTADVLRVLSPLAAADSTPPGAVVVDVNPARRRAGAHYTPREVGRSVVERALGPLLQDRSSAEILGLRICDPAMGDGALLSEAARLAAEHLSAARVREGRPGEPGAALRDFVARCVFGVDVDPVAVDLARWSLARLAGGEALDLSGALRAGDALVGPVANGRKSAEPRPPPELDGLDWTRAFPDAFRDSRAGFDCCIGNPPWVAYVGRAAQPLSPALFRHYQQTNRAFRGYRTLHGLFVRRAAELLRPGGRLGLVLPTSVADLDGYAPTRQALDELCAPDGALTDFGDRAFDGVFQPCMALTATRRDAPAPERAGSIWQLARSDLDEVGSALLARLSALPALPASVFGERGFQTTADDLAHISRRDEPQAPFAVPIREGTDVGEMRLHPVASFLDPAGLTGRLRPDAEWRAVGVLIRQTARYPIAVPSDGAAFRNSILAGFASEGWSAEALAAYLNSSAIRWLHHSRHRDARQGMPQLKIGHLRVLPDLRAEGPRRALDAVGRRLSAANAGIDEASRRALDDLVFDALGFTSEERTLVLGWALTHPVPRRRKG